MSPSNHGGWLNDGTTAVEIGYNVWANPIEGRSNVVLAPQDLPAVVLDSGGGLVDLTVTGQRVRANLGDAERWIYQTLAAAMQLGPAALGVENYQGAYTTWSNAVCLGGKGSVEAAAFAQIEFDCQVGQLLTAPVWADPPDTDDVYSGTLTAMDYAAGGVALGDGDSMKFEARRNYPVRPVPRARGARSVGPASGATMRLIVTGWIAAGSRYLPSLLTVLAREIGPGPVSLTANGNAYADCVLERLAPKSTPWRATNFEATFVQQIGPGVAPVAPTTAGE